MHTRLAMGTYRVSGWWHGLSWTCTLDFRINGQAGITAGRPENRKNGASKLKICTRDAKNLVSNFRKKNKRTGTSIRKSRVNPTAKWVRYSDKLLEYRGYTNVEILSQQWTISIYLKNISITNCLKKIQLSEKGHSLHRLVEHKLNISILSGMLSLFRQMS